MGKNKELVPIGTAWRAVAPDGGTGTVWLSQRFPSGREVWMYTFERDRCQTRMDWAPTRRKAVELCSLEFFDACRAPGFRPPVFRHMAELMPTDRF